MKLSVAAAIAAAFSMQAVIADDGKAPFRTPAPAAFSQEDLSRFNLDPATAAKVDQYRKAGYKVMAMTPDELAKAKAGQASATWLVLGLVAVVVIVAVAAGGGSGSSNDGGGIY